MNTEEKIVQGLEGLQEGQKALQADVQKQGKQIEGLIDVQQGFDHRVGHVWPLSRTSESSHALALRC